MKTARLAQVLFSATVAGFVAASVAATGSQWLLMSRDGDCVGIESLKRRIPDLGDVRDPYSFMKLMRERGHRVSSNEISGAKGKAVEVKVPEKELFLLFVPPAFCEKTRAK